MRKLTRRSIMLSGAALVAGCMSQPAEAATGSVILKIVSGGFIIGVGGGSGVLLFQGVRYPLSLGGVNSWRNHWRLRRGIGRDGLQPS